MRRCAPEGAARGAAAPAVEQALLQEGHLLHVPLHLRRSVITSCNVCSSFHYKWLLEFACILAHCRSSSCWPCHQRYLHTLQVQSAQSQCGRSVGAISLLSFQKLPLCIVERTCAIDDIWSFTNMQHHDYYMMYNVIISLALADWILCSLGSLQVPVVKGYELCHRVEALKICLVFILLLFCDASFFIT